MKPRKQVSNETASEPKLSRIYIWATQAAILQRFAFKLHPRVYAFAFVLQNSNQKLAIFHANRQNGISTHNIPLAALDQPNCLLSIIKRLPTASSVVADPEPPHV